VGSGDSLTTGEGVRASEGSGVGKGISQGFSVGAAMMAQGVDSGDANAQFPSRLISARAHPPKAFFHLPAFTRRSSRSEKSELYPLCNGADFSFVSLVKD
jgi:hypothetical protein